MVNVRKKRYTVSEKTRRQTNMYHLKRVYKALRSTEWYDFDEVIEEILNGKTI